MPDLILELVDVVKRYDAVRDIEASNVLEDINLAVHPGEKLAITGPSGSGKSTLLNIIGTLDRPTSGRVLFEGTDLGGLDDRHLAAVRNRRIGFIFQDHHLLPQCTAIENVLVPSLATSDPDLRRGARERAPPLLDRVGLAERMHHRPGELSVGQCQRVAVVRALINRPRLVLADEPTGSLDRTIADELADLLIELNREEKVTLIVATHAQPLAAKMERVLELRDGGLGPAGGT